MTTPTRESDLAYARARATRDQYAFHSPLWFRANKAVIRAQEERDLDYAFACALGEIK